MMINNKKGTVGFYFMIFVMLFMIGYVAVFLSDEFPEIEYIGASQKTILDSYDLVEKTFLYIDMSVELATKLAVSDMAFKGGFHTGTFEDEKKEYPCGAVVYPVIGSDKPIDDCVPDIDDSFPEYFTKHFNSLIARYSEVNLLFYNFDISMLSQGSKTDITVSSSEDIVIPIYVFSDYYYFPDGKDSALGEFEGTVTEEGYIKIDGLKSLSRGSTEIDTIVMHYTVTKNAETAYNVLRDRGLSYHYVIDKDGTIYNFVDESRSAQHAGCQGKDSAKCSISYNSRSIGISLVGCGFDEPGCRVSACYQGKKIENKCWEPFTSEQLNSAVNLIVDVAYRRIQQGDNFEINSASIIPHDQVDKGKSDIGPAFEMDKIFELAKKRLEIKIIG